MERTVTANSSPGATIWDSEKLTEPPTVTVTFYILTRDDELVEVRPVGGGLRGDAVRWEPA